VPEASRARAAFGRGDWPEAYRLLSETARRGSADADDLDRGDELDDLEDEELDEDVVEELEAELDELDLPG